MTDNEDGIEWGHKMTSLLEFIEMKGWDISEWWDEHMVTRSGITINLGTEGYSVKEHPRFPEPKFINWQPKGCGQPQTSGVRVEYHLLSEEDDHGSFNDWLEEMATGEESGDGGGGRMLYADFETLDDAYKFTLTLEQNEISHLIVEA